MTTTYPPLEMRSAIANPIVTGTLYTAATLTDLGSPARIDGGVRIEQTNGGDGYGTWPLGCPTPADAGEKRGGRADALEFPAFAVWAVDECSLVGVSEQESHDLAVQRLRLSEERVVSGEFAGTLLDHADNRGEAPEGLVGAVGALEWALGATGVRGVVHAHRRLIATAQHRGLIVRGSAGRLETPGGHAWAFGTGYDDLEDTLVGTGPVTIYRTPPVVTPAVNTGQNERMTLAEREVLPTFELSAIAYQIGA